MNCKLVTLGLGTNLGDKRATLAGARDAIERRLGPIVAATSEIITKAWGVTDQPDFLNQVVVVHPNYFALATADGQAGSYLHALLDVTQRIENDLGRVRETHWGPRTCDIDIIFADRLSLQTERITLPHPWWRERDFVGGLIERELPWLLLSREAGGADTNNNA